MPEDVIEAGFLQLQPAPFVDRRRANRIEDPSPHLIALMRRPSAEQRRKVQVYDAPSFRPPQVRVDRRRVRQQRIRLAIATGLCAGFSAAAFETMLFVWN